TDNRLMPRKRRNSNAFDDLFTDYSLTKSELSEVLGVSRDSVVRWSKLAFYFIPSFRESYPRLGDGSFDSEAPLNPYQSWVLSRIRRDFAKLRLADRVKMSIKKYPQNYSKYTYQIAQKEISKLAA
ncbi:MAG: hypothetical protein ACKPE3_40295, partial [Sphaerospermopsis kisseleviana]